MMFLDFPAYLDEDCAERCGLPAEVCDRFTVRSTGGPIENVRIRCPSGHWFNGPIEFLTCHADPGIEQVAAPVHRAAHDTCARRPGARASPNGGRRRTGRRH